MCLFPLKFSRTSYFCDFCGRSLILLLITWYPLKLIPNLILTATLYSQKTPVVIIHLQTFHECLESPLVNNNVFGLICPNVDSVFVALFVRLIYGGSFEDIIFESLEISLLKPFRDLH
jgi:hypothetical protein